MEVVEDFESRPHKAVTFLVERDKEIIRDLRQLKMPKALSGHSGGKLPGRNKAARGKEGKEEEEEVQKMENKVMSAILTSGPLESYCKGRCCCCSRREEC